MYIDIYWYSLLVFPIGVPNQKPLDNRYAINGQSVDNITTTISNTSRPCMAGDRELAYILFVFI